MNTKALKATSGKPAKGGHVAESLDNEQMRNEYAPSPDKSGTLDNYIGIIP